MRIEQTFHPVEFVLAAIVRFLPDCFVDRGEGDLAPDLLRFRIFPNAAVLPYVHYTFTLPNTILLMTEKEIVPMLKEPIQAAKEEFLSLEIGHIIETVSESELRIEESRKALTDSAPWVKI